MFICVPQFLIIDNPTLSDKKVDHQNQVVCPGLVNNWYLLKEIIGRISVPIASEHFLIMVHTDDNSVVKRGEKKIFFREETLSDMPQDQFYQNNQDSFLSWPPPA